MPSGVDYDATSGRIMANVQPGKKIICLEEF